jgi:hypothetical protein
MGVCNMFLIHFSLDFHRVLSVFYLEHDVSETEFCLRLQVEPTQMGPIQRASLYVRTEAKPIGFVAAIRRQLFLLFPSEYVPPEEGDRIQSRKRRVFRLQNAKTLIHEEVSNIMYIRKQYQ